MMITHQVESNMISKESWIELNEEQSEQINGGRRYYGGGRNIITNTSVQLNIAVIVGDNAAINQGNSLRNKAFT